MANNMTGKQLVEFATSKLGTPYVYGAKFQDGPLTQAKVNFLAKNYPSTVNAAYLKKIQQKGLIGKVCVDCSGLIAGYTNKNIGSSQLYSTAYKKLAFKSYRDFAPGVVLWRQGHVGVFAGLGSDGKYHVLEAKGIDYGTVNSIVTDSSKWTYGLTFSYMDYTYDTKVNAAVGAKNKNPYTMPVTTVRYGTKGEGARWVQYELVEAGFNLPFTFDDKSYKGVVIDGDIGEISVAAIRQFQRSAKLKEDGIVGPETRKAFKLDDK